MIKLIVFDLDDTLIDTGTFFIKSIKEAAARVKLPIPTDSQVKAVLGLPFEPVMEGLWPGVDHEEVKNAYYEIELTSSCDCFPGIKELIADLKNKNYQLGILTSRKMKGVVRVMKNAGIKQEDFSFLETPEAQAFHKPDPRVFDKLLTDAEEMGISKDEILYVGDTLHDMGAARGAGLHFVALVHGHTEKERFVENGLDQKFIAEDPDGVNAIIKNIDKSLEVVND